MTLDLTLPLLAILCLTVIAAYFSAADTALTAVSNARIHMPKGSPQARALNVLISDRERVLGAILLGKNIVTILAGALATWVALRFLAEGAILVATIVMTSVVLIFSEVLPRTLAIIRTERIALGVARPMRAIVGVLSPIVEGVQTIVWRVLSLFGITAEEEAPVLSAHQELRGAIDLHHQEGSVEREQRAMLGGILDLRELRVADVMVHRKNMIAIEAGGPIAETVELVLSSGHTRFPMWKDDPENIVGLLHIKDLLRVLAERAGAREGIDLLALAIDPWFVPDTTTLDEQVHAFRQRRAHFALVVDEYGTLQGLVTLEDILEEIFGNLAEAHDVETPPGLRPQPDGSYVVPGLTPVRELNRELDWGLPDEEATTIAGVVIHAARIIPEVGQLFSFHGFKFEILGRKRNQVTSLRITPPRREGLGQIQSTVHAP